MGGVDQGGLGGRGHVNREVGGRQVLHWHVLVVAGNNWGLFCRYGLVRRNHVVACVVINWN